MARTAAILLLGLAALAPLSGCRRSERPKLDPVRALKSGVQPGFRPPADGVLTDAQIEGFLRVRRQAPAAEDRDALRAIGADPAEFAWVRARVREALLALEADRVAAAAGEAYARALAVLRDARRSARDAKTTARLDSELGAVERERASLRKNNALPPSVLKNAARLARRRAEIEAASP